MSCGHAERRLALEHEVPPPPLAPTGRARVACLDCGERGPWGEGVIDAVRLWDRGQDFAYVRAERDQARAERDDALKAMKSARDISEGRRKALAEARAERDEAIAQRDALKKALKKIASRRSIRGQDLAAQIAVEALADLREGST